jgi:NTE family protein
MPSIALVLGAGGAVGSAWHAGVLAALDEVTGWDARTADLVVGTSAGSIIASSLRAGLAPADHLARAMGKPLSDEGERILEGIDDFARIELPDRPLLSLPSVPVPAALQLLPAALAPWTPTRPRAAVVGMLPRGRVPIDALADRIRALNGGAWPEAPTWICTLRLSDGQRVVFGRDDVEVDDLGTAVHASCAVAGVFEPVPIGDHDYVDGGAHSPTNIDLLAGLGFDLVVVSSPMSTDVSGAGGLRDLGDLAVSVASLGGRALPTWSLRRETSQVRATGTPVLTIQPTAADLPVLGLNSLDRNKVPAVAEQAYQSTMKRLDHPGAGAELGILLSSA